MQLFLRIETKIVCAIESDEESSKKNILSCWKKVVLLQIETDIEEQLCKRQ